MSGAGKGTSVWSEELHLGRIILNSKNQDLRMDGSVGRNASLLLQDLYLQLPPFLSHPCEPPSSRGHPCSPFALPPLQSELMHS